MLVPLAFAGPSKNQPTTGGQKPAESAVSGRIDIEEAKLDIERQKLKLEEKQLALQELIETRKTELEFYKTWVPSLSISIPLVLAIITFASSIVVQRSKAKADFALKAAEIAMLERNPGLVKYRVTVLKRLFPQWLPNDFGDSFNPQEHFGPNYETKLELLRMIADKTTSQEQIIEAWKRLFPKDRVESK
jgi:hypothetical protein